MSKVPKKVAKAAKAAKGTKKDGKKTVDRAAIEQQWQQEKDQLCLEEERDRLEVELSQQVLRKECKLTKRKAIHKLLTDQNKEIKALNAQIIENHKSTGIQMVKLEDELARLAMSKEIVSQQLTAAQAELAKLKGDDGSKAMINNLTAQVQALEEEKHAKAKETEEAIEALNQKLAKQITENRLMRIRSMDSEAEWGRRVQKLEDEMHDALRQLISERMDGNVHSVNNFKQTLESSKDEYLEALREAQENVIGLADCLVDLKSMHSNLPDRIRAELENLPPDELLLIIDSLSFEEGVLQFLEAKFPRS